MVSIFTNSAETRVNTVVHAAGDFKPDIAHLNDGGYIVVWDGGTTGAAVNEIYAQRYDAAGNAVGVMARINTYTSHDQLEPSVTALNDGGYVVTWTSDQQDSDGYGVYQQRFDAAGTTVGSAGRVNTTLASAQSNSVVKGLSDGGYIVAWDGWLQDNGGANPGVYMQRYSATGHKVGGETLVNTTTAGFQDYADIVLLQNGNYVVTWQSDPTGAGRGIFSQLYTGAGVAIGGETRVDLGTDGDAAKPATSVLNDGSYIVTWQGTHDIHSDAEIHLRHYAADGTALTGDVAVTTQMPNDNITPDVTALSGGGYVVTWVMQDSFSYYSQVCFQRYDANDNKVGVETLIPSFGDGNGSTGQMAVAAVADDGFVVTWTSYSHPGSGTVASIYQKTVLATNDLSGSQYVYGTSGDDALDGGEGADLMFGGASEDFYTVDDVNDLVRDDGGPNGLGFIYASVSYDLTGTFVQDMILSGGADINATGDDAVNYLRGNSGANVLTGGAGGDTLDGDAGADTLYGGAGDDYFNVDNPGDKVIETTGQGYDAVRATLTWSLAGTFVELLYLVGIGNMNGTGNSLNNTIYGNASANVLNGGYGNDTLDGGTGADTMIGGKGDDVFWVDNAGDVVSETVGGGTDLVISYVTYSLSGVQVENLWLQGTDDINATGNSLANYLSGNDGNNRLNGGYGADLLQGGLGADTFVFATASGADTIADFSAGEGDSIDVHAYTHGVAQPGFITQSGGDVTITLGGSNVITVTNATVGDVSAHMVW